MSDYTSVTEAPGLRVTSEAMRMVEARYGFAADLCDGKDVLEVACGGGIGLGCLATRARQVIGGDYTMRLLEVAKRHYGARFPLLCLDAARLPFRDRSFDVVILNEAIYYLARPAAFVEEASRVLRKDGVLIMCTVNREWAEFNPSPFSTRYWSAADLRGLLRRQFGQVLVYAGFPASQSRRDTVVCLIRRVAIVLRLIPGTMKGKELLKRIFMGRLVSLPAEVRLAEGSYDPPVLIADAAANLRQYKVLYTAAHLASCAASERAAETGCVAQR